MPYLPIDPADLGRSYDAVIRVNSQSGKGGIAYLLEAEYGLELPRRLQIEFSQAVQAVMDDSGKEQSAADIWHIFEKEYALGTATAPQLSKPSISQGDDGVVTLATELAIDGRTVRIEGRGDGPIDAFVAGLNRSLDADVRVLDYHEHAIGSGADAKAVAYLELRIGSGVTLFGVGIDTSIVTASLKAIVGGWRRSQGASAARAPATATAVA